MNIKKYEFKKIISSPIFIVLILIFLAYNTMIIVNKSNIRNDLKVLNEIVDEVGYVINDEMMTEFNLYYEKQLKEANNLLEKKGYGNYNNISEFLENNYSYANGDSNFSSDEIRFLDKLSIIESYYFLSSNLQQNYQSIDINKMANNDLAKGNYSDNTNEIIKRNYNEFAKRFKELKSNGEQKNLFFNGKIYRMHSFLFKDIFIAMIYEIMVLTVLITSFIFNYEFDSKTVSTVYCTKRGRDLTKDKLMVALSSIVFVTTLILGITLLIYFNVFDYSRLWGASVNSFFGQECNMPYMTWFNMPVLKYLLAIISVVYILEIIFCGLSFILSLLVKNTYIVFFSFAIIVGCGMILPQIIPQNSDIFLFSVYTPFTLIFNPSWWFMLRRGVQSSKYYEIITLIIWIIIIVVIGVICTKRFKKENMK